jgi:hypothetical protein
MDFLVDGVVFIYNKKTATLYRGVKKKKNSYRGVKKN